MDNKLRVAIKEAENRGVQYRRGEHNSCEEMLVQKAARQRLCVDCAAESDQMQVRTLCEDNFVTDGFLAV